MPFPLQRQIFLQKQKSIEILVPDAEAVKEACQKQSHSFPYWSKVWPAAIGLSEFILHHPQYIQNKKVLELGAGLGLPSLVAASYATHVLCTDFVEEAIAVVAQSATHHHLQNFCTAVVDWRCLPNDLKADVLLLSDVNYEPEGFATLTKTILAFLDAGTIVLLSTPQRLLAKAFVAPLLSACILQEDYTVKQNTTGILVTVMALQKRTE